MISNDTNIAKSFAFLSMANPVTSGGFITLDKKIHENTPKIFRTPKASLSKMTLSFTDCTGTPFNFGTDTTPPNKALQNTLVFQIVTLEKRTTQLSQRNVY